MPLQQMDHHCGLTLPLILKSQVSYKNLNFLLGREIFHPKECQNESFKLKPSQEFQLVFSSSSKNLAKKNLRITQDDLIVVLAHVDSYSGFPSQFDRFFILPLRKFSNWKEFSLFQGHLETVFVLAWRITLLETTQ